MAFCFPSKEEEGMHFFFFLGCIQGMKFIDVILNQAQNEYKNDNNNQVALHHY